jgi:hypothetical protein
VFGPTTGGLAVLEFLAVKGRRAVRAVLAAVVKADFAAKSKRGGKGERFVCCGSF